MGLWRDVVWEHMEVGKGLQIFQSMFPGDGLNDSCKSFSDIAPAIIRWPITFSRKAIIDKAYSLLVNKRGGGGCLISSEKFTTEQRDRT